MDNTNLYWQVYKNLEREFLALAEVIHIDDYQLESVYSMRIADLLMHTAVEVESLSKHLYMENGGTKTDPSKMYFDTDCLAHLNSLWNLEAKVVLVVSPNLFLEKEGNIIFTPLKNAQYRQPNSAEWEKAYQAVKHDRINELKPWGRLIYLLQALAALYILNLYNRDEKKENIDSNAASALDMSFGSKLFAVKLHRAPGLGADGIYHPSKDYDECVYIQDYELKSKQAAVDDLVAFNSCLADVLMEKYRDHLQNLSDEGKEIVVSQEGFDKFKTEIIKKENIFKQAMQRSNHSSAAFLNLHYDILLNKNQYLLAETK